MCIRDRQRTGGHGFPVDVKLTPEAVKGQWERITNFDDGRADHPEDPQAGTAAIMKNMSNRKSGPPKAAAKKGGEPNKEILANIENAKKAKAQGTEFVYTERDVILYSKFQPTTY